MPLAGETTQDMGRDQPYKADNAGNGDAACREQARTSQCQQAGSGNADSEVGGVFFAKAHEVQSTPARQQQRDSQQRGNKHKRQISPPPALKRAENPENNTGNRFFV